MSAPPVRTSEHQCISLQISPSSRQLTLTHSWHRGFVPGTARPLALVTYMLQALLMHASGIASPAPDGIESLVQADRHASTTLWEAGWSAVLRTSFNTQAVVLIPGAPLMTAVGVLTAGGNQTGHIGPGRMFWDAVGIQLSSDTILGVTWGTVSLLQDSTMPAGGRYVAAWEHRSEGWLIRAFALLGVSPASPEEWNRLRHSTPGSGTEDRAGPFLQADREFALEAVQSNASAAFRSWAAPDAFIFGRRGFIVKGRDMIGRAVAGPTRWEWTPVAGGGSPDGSLGWTAGEATLTPTEGAPFRSKYLSIWERQSDGVIRFIIDAGNQRP